MGASLQAGYKITSIVQQPVSTKATEFGDYYGNIKKFVKPDEEESKGTSLNTSTPLLFTIKISIGYN